MHKYLETPLHALICFLDLFRRRYDVVLLCNAANAPFAWLVRLRGIPLLINVDGIERLRSKWSKIGKLWYALGERCAVWFADKIIADAEVIARYYREVYRVEPAVIAYGAKPAPLPPGPVLEQFELAAQSYLLYVSRLEPENNALCVIEAYGQVDTKLPLVIVGDAPYATQYKTQLQAAAQRVAPPGSGKRVVFTGFQFGAAYRELRSNCLLYVQATEVGGTHPALVEAMAYGNAIVANDVPEHREVLGDAGVYYAKNDSQALARQIALLLADPGERNEFTKAAATRASQLYSWEVIADIYEELLRQRAS